MTKKFSTWIAIVTLAAVYFCAGKLGLSLARLHASASPVWPAAGVAVAAMLLLGSRAWPGIFVGAFLVNLSAQRGLAPAMLVAQAIGVAMGNTLEALAAAHFARHFAGGRHAFERVRGVFHFSFWSGALSATVGATMGSLTLLACGLLKPNLYGPVWLTWWVGDAVGIIMVAPLILIWAARSRLSLTRKRTLEAALLLSAMAAILEFIFFGWLRSDWISIPSAFLLPLVVWAALRFESWGAISVVFIISAVAVVATSQRIGVFALADLNESLLILLTFVSVMLITSLALAAVVAERKATAEQLRLTNGRFQLAMAASRMGNWTRELTGERRGNWSQRNELIYGLDPGEFDGSEEAFYNLVHPGDRDRVRRTFDEATKKRREDLEMEFQFLRRTGGVGWVLSRARIFYDENGTALRAAGVDIDITERKETEEALRASEEKYRLLNSDLEQRVRERTAQLQAANKELEAFCYSVSHDLRAPLRTIRGFGDVLLEQFNSQLDARGQDFLRRTCQAAAQMDRLVDDLLKLSRASRAAMESGEIRMSQLADEIAAELKRSEPARHVEFVIAPDLRARGDERLVRLVLDNLLRNAWKFTGRRQDARIEFGRQNGDGSAFFIRDNGAGFDMAYVGKLFGVFQRLHSASEFPGSGVGLALAHRIIARHNGRIWAEGRTNHGATFYFTLPPAEDVAQDERTSNIPV